MATHLQTFWGIFLSLSLYYIHSTSQYHVHIVYLGCKNVHEPLLTSKSHVQILSKVFSSEDDAKEAMLYSYKHSFSGFAASLNSTQATILAKMEGVISVFRSKTLELHTTRSWDFMGLTLDNGELSTLQRSYGDDVVVGIIDSGIWPESESFREMPGMKPVPSSWKGTCEKGDKFPKKTCNRKLIGARYYLKGYERRSGPLNVSATLEYRSARDLIGHGTHTASIAVGSPVKNANFMGMARGTARGGAPRARLAVYKVCWKYKNLIPRCTEDDILAAFDDAVGDGVHVISVSLGQPPPLIPFLFSSKDIGSFHASQMGISVVFSAGNDGPDPSVVGNVDPWSTCVAATSIDRTFPTPIIVGTNISIMGEGFIIKPMKKKLASARNGVCDPLSLRGVNTSGAIILCFTVRPISRDNAIDAVFQANGSGVILAEPITKNYAEHYPIPTVDVDLNQGTQIYDYILSTTDPTVQILPSKTTIGHSPAPTVAEFSSRGPSSKTPNILKPDISAPGLNILGAWPPKTPPALSAADGLSVNWNIQSGTSMSCPHVSGVVALLKSAHPDWSPAAIKSAIMTTAYGSDTSSDNILAGGSMKLADPFDIGAGHIDPLKAIDPGLVYDMGTRDYILFLCSIGYTTDQINKIVIPCMGIDVSCPKKDMIDINLNYPSIMVSDLRSTTTIKRTLRNVGHTGAIYFASVLHPNGVQVVVWPRILIFSWHKQEISYHITLTPLKNSQGRYDFGEIVWHDGHHHVRSPLVVSVNNVENVDDIVNHPNV